MSIPYIPGAEKGTTLEGNIEILDDVKHIEFSPDKKFKMKNIVRTDINDFSDEAFLLHHVLTERECQEFIDAAEKLSFDEIKGARPDYRSCKRITIQNDAIADILWSRIKHFIHSIEIKDDPHDLHIHGPPTLMRGKWKPVGLNSVFRLCRYLPGGHFAPHFDGHYDKTSSDRSLKTFMLYLNGDFTGGATNFVREDQTLYKDAVTGKYCAEDKNIICSVQPETGLAIIFNHHRLHEGAQLKDGMKYILRTDVMFHNVDQHLSKDYSTAVHLIQQAETLENAGKCMEAAELYRKAFKLAPELETAT